MLINVIPESHTKKLSYKIVYSKKLKVPSDIALRPLQSTCIPAIRNHVQELYAIWQGMQQKLQAQAEKNKAQAD